MAKAKFHSFRGEKSALIMVKRNAFEIQSHPVYVPKDAVIAVLGDTPEKGDAFDIPDGYTLAPMLDENGAPRTTKPDADGVTANLMCLVY